MATILIDKLLSACVKQGASDIHITVGQPPVFRLHGRMRKLETKVLDADDTVSLMKSITPDRCQRELQEQGSADFGFAFGDEARFRVSVFKQRGNIAMVLRQIPNDKLTPEQLGLTDAIIQCVNRPRGLFLVTGPTGSGKSTTLASLVNYLNETVDHHIITIEDPIEFYHEHIKSTVNQREIGVDTHSFANALRGALRQDPDVILVGEMRDFETIETALTAAETGHLVMSTLHTLDATETINRIISVFPPYQQKQVRLQLSTVLKAVISQRLVPRADGKGRVPALEILVSTGLVRELIADKDRTKELSEAIAKGHTTYGMQSFDQSLMQLVKEGLVTYEEALKNVSNPDDFALRYRGIASTSDSNWDDFQGPEAEPTEGLEEDVLEDDEKADDFSIDRF